MKLKADIRLAGWALITLVVSGLGGLAADALGLPAAYLCGGALAVSIAALFGMKATILSPMRDIAFIIIGMSMGASVSKDTLSLIVHWPISIFALLSGLVVIITLTTLILHRLFGIDRITAFLSSCPGHLSFIIGISESGRGNTRQIAVIQSIRVLILTIAVPVGAQVMAAGAIVPPHRAADMPLGELVLLALGCTLGGYLFKRLGVPAGFVLGAMLVSTIARLMGLFDGSVPLPLVVFSFIFMGALIGSRFVGVSASELRQSLLGGLVVGLMSIGAVTLITFMIAPIINMPFGQVWVALAPGGLETMGALGIAFGYDTAFIAAHHAIRLLALGLAIPFISMAILGRRAPD